jgi:hypothetical protein
MKSIRLTKHALGYLDMRGFTTEEVELAIRKSNWIPMTSGRFECSMEFSVRLDMEREAIPN